MEKYVIKVNFKMVCSMVLVLNILMKLILQERSKLIRLSLDLTREVGLNMKGDLKMIKDKDLVKYFLRMEFGQAISKMVNRMGMEFGKDQEERN